MLVDYKGGSAFDACGALPHVVGLVTDLDERLAERALRCLEAELRHRERVLRDRGATDLAHYRTLTKSGAEPPRPDQSAAEAAELGAEPPRLDRRSADATTAETWPPLPRLMVVIDEFAALAGRAARLHGLPGQRGPARPQSGHAPGVGHPAPCGGGERQYPHQHRTANRPADAGRHRFGRHPRQPRGRGHRPGPARPGLRPLRPRRVGGVPSRPGHRGHRLPRRPASGARPRRPTRTRARGGVGRWRRRTRRPVPTGAGRGRRLGPQGRHPTPPPLARPPTADCLAGRVGQSRLHRRRPDEQCRGSYRLGGHQLRLKDQRKCWFQHGGHRRPHHQQCGVRLGRTIPTDSASTP